jgi:ESX secretion system protein EccD
VGGARSLAVGLAAVGLAIALLVAGAVAARRLNDRLAGTVAAGLAVPYAAIGTAFAVRTGMGGGQRGALWLVGPGELLGAAAALLIASGLAAAAVGRGSPLWTAGMCMGALGCAGSVLGLVTSPAAAAASLLVVVLAMVGAAPYLAVHLARLPVPVASSDAQVVAAEPRPDPASVHAAVGRAQDMLTGIVLGGGSALVCCVLVLSRAGGVAGAALAALGAGTLCLRARLFPVLAVRLALLGTGGSGLAVLAWRLLAQAHPVVWLAGELAVGLGAAAVVTVAAYAPRRRAGSPYLARLGDMVDLAVVVAVVPVACAVLGLYTWVVGLVG